MHPIECASCGTFVLARLADGAPVPIEEECPGCGGTAFDDLAPGDPSDGGRTPRSYPRWTIATSQPTSVSSRNVGGATKREAALRSVLAPTITRS